MQFLPHRERCTLSVRANYLEVNCCNKGQNWPFHLDDRIRRIFSLRLGSALRYEKKSDDQMKTAKIVWKWQVASKKVQRWRIICFCAFFQVFTSKRFQVNKPFMVVASYPVEFSRLTMEMDSERCKTRWTCCTHGGIKPAWEICLQHGSYFYAMKRRKYDKFCGKGDDSRDSIPASRETVKASSQLYYRNSHIKEISAS